MNSFFRKTEAFLALGKSLRDSLRQSLTATSTFLANDENTGKYPPAAVAFAGVLRQILEVDNVIPEKNLTILYKIVEDPDALEKIRQLGDLTKFEKIDPKSAARIFSMLSKEEQKKILDFFIHLAAALKLEDISFLEEIAVNLDFSAEYSKFVYNKITLERQRRLGMMRSGAGVITALFVIFVFILTATLLRSVAFGLIGAYILLPVEKYFENKIRQQRGIGYWTANFLEKLFYPLHTIARKITRNSAHKVLSEEEKHQKEENSIINKAVAQTAIVGFIVLAGISIFIFSLTGRYVSRISSFFSSLKDTNIVAQFKEDEKNLDKVVVKKDTNKANVVTANKINKITKVENKSNDNQLPEKIISITEKLKKVPVLGFLVERTKNILSDDANRKNLVSWLVRRTGGIFSFTFDLLGQVLVFFSDILLAIFFGLLFLIKLASFGENDNRQGRMSEYLVRTVFNGKWLPVASEGTITEATRIINGTMDRLTIWVRGYITLVIVDSTVYMIVFFFLGIPYFPLLGILAGCGILLPYIGPIISCLVTLAVAILTGCSENQILLIPVMYLIYNGCIEQFILYPAVIGDSLGLTTLETIIVVLLGAIFAGIPGMILALPAASVIKFLVPQIYRCLDTETQED